jgi:adenylate cyclase class IV
LRQVDNSSVNTLLKNLSGIYEMASKNMQTKNFEVEITGPLTNEDLVKIQEYLSSWKYEGRFDRYLINFTTEEMRKNRLDVRARITNGVPELVVKHGEWGSGKRVETLVECKHGQFLPLVTSLSAMGLNIGVGGHRISERYTREDMEVAIIEVPGYTYFYEAELMVSQGEGDDAMNRLQEWASNYGLPVLNKEEYLRFIDDLDANANDLIDTREESSWAMIRQRISKQP